MANVRKRHNAEFKSKIATVCAADCQLKPNLKLI